MENLLYIVVGRDDLSQVVEQLYASKDLETIEQKSLQQQTLEQMKNVDIRTVDRDTLVDIRDVKINPNLTKEERLIDFVRQIKNPYCYRYGKTVIKISHSDIQVTLEERLENFFKSL